VCAQRHAKAVVVEVAVSYLFIIEYIYSVCVIDWGSTSVDATIRAVAAVAAHAAALSPR
jgi:hypothetical protein